ncbi:MAG TPA: hypothetical protein VIK91_02540 [Nannocystis sp.]
MPRSPAVLCALSLGACTPDQAPDPFDPAELARIAEDGGNARGEALTGQYLTLPDVLACDCPARMGVDLCAPQAAGLVGLQGPSAIVQVDGYLTMQPEWVSLPWALSGAIDRDGGFLLAGLSRVELGVNALAVRARFEGSFAADRTFEGELGLRLLGDIPGGAVDCRITYAIDGIPVAFY